MEPDAHLSRAQTVAFVAVIVASLLAIGALDAVTGIAPDLTILYLLPVVAATYSLGLRWGLVVGLGAVLTQLAALLLGENVGLTRTLVDAALHAAVFALVVVGTDRILTQLREVRRLEELRDRDLAAARSAHLNVVGDIKTDRTDIDVSSQLRFMHEVGGDYVRFADNGGRRSFFCVADISGKGVVAALFTALLDQTVRSASRGSDLGKVMQVVNRRIHDVVPPNMFVTMFAASIDEQRLSWFNAGHEPALLWCRRSGRIFTLQTEAALPLGVMEHLDGKPASADFEPGDVLLVVTDGVTESRRFRSTGREELERVLGDTAAAGHSAEAIVAAVYAAALADNEEPTDDMAVLCVRYVGSMPRQTQPTAEE